MKKFNEGDIAIVTTQSGKQFVGVYTLAPGIDYFWNPLIEKSAPSALRDPDTHAKVIGRIN